MLIPPAPITTEDVAGTHPEITAPPPPPPPTLPAEPKPPAPPPPTSTANTVVTSAGMLTLPVEVRVL